MALHSVASCMAFSQSSGRLGANRIAADGPPRDVVNSALPQRVPDVDAQVMGDPVTGARRVLPNLHAGARMS